MRKPPEVSGSKTALYRQFYRHQQQTNKMPFEKFCAAVDLLQAQRHTRSEVARIVGIRDTRARRLGTFLRSQTGDKKYAQRSKSLRLSGKFPDAVKKYLELRTDKKLSIARAAKAIGVDRYTALDWEREHLSENQRQAMEKDMRSQLNAHPKRNQMRLLLSSKNPNGTFKYPPKAIMDALGVKPDAIRTANAANPAIRTKADIDDVAARFRGGRSVYIGALTEEAKRELPKLLELQESRIIEQNRKKLVTLTPAKRILLEAKLSGMLHINGSSENEFRSIKRIIREIFSVPNCQVPVRDIHHSQKISNNLKQNLLPILERVRTTDGTLVFEIKNGVIALNPKIANFV